MNLSLYSVRVLNLMNIGSANKYRFINWQPYYIIKICLAFRIIYIQKFCLFMTILIIIIQFSKLVFLNISFTENTTAEIPHYILLKFKILKCLKIVCIFKNKYYSYRKVNNNRIDSTIHIYVKKGSHASQVTHI